MKSETDYIEINKKLWNLRTPVHLESAFYNVPEFLKGRSSLNQIELDLLGNVNGLSILHLQCHFGQDSISLARMGADVTAVDFSEEAIKAGKELTVKTNTNVKFICCDLFELPKHLDEKFDIVFTSYGTIGWLPDIKKWANIVSKYLKPAGKFVFAEFHPVVWMFDDYFEKISYDYFKSDPILETQQGSYADQAATIETSSMGWNHGLAEVINALLEGGLELAHFKEYDYSPYNCLKNMVEYEPGKYRLASIPKKIPMVYSLVAKKSQLVNV